MKKIILILFGFMLVITVFSGCINNEEMAVLGPEEDIFEITMLNSPDDYSIGGNLQLTFEVANIYDYSSPPYATSFFYRVRDMDMSGTIDPDEGWQSKTSDLIYEGQKKTGTITFSIPGGNGMGNSYHGRLEISHKYSEHPYIKFYLDDYMDFTVSYKNPDSSNHEPTLGQISGPSSAMIGDPVNFYVNTYDADGDSVDVRWDMGDGTVTGWKRGGGVSSITHTYYTAGSYSVKAQPRDNHDTGSWTPGKTIEITDDGSSSNNLDITIKVKDKETDEFLKNSVVVINSVSKNTNEDGTVVFSVDSGTYKVEINKEGYSNYNEIHTFTSDTTLTVALTKSQGIPGYELLTLFFALFVAVLVLRFRGI